MDSGIKSQSSFSHIKSKIKVVFLGDQSTGKTSILLRFMYDKFDEGQGATVGIDFMAKNLTVLQHHLRLQLWDTAGQERFRSLIPSYLKDASIAFITFDLTNRRTFESVREWIDLCHQNKKQKSTIVLIGNKCDLETDRQVTFDEARNLAKSEAVQYLEVSAKNNTNIKQMFTSAAEQYLKQMLGAQFDFKEQACEEKSKPLTQLQRSPQRIELSREPGLSGKPKKKAGCC